MSAGIGAFYRSERNARFGWTNRALSESPLTRLYRERATNALCETEEPEAPAVMEWRNRKDYSDIGPARDTDFARRGCCVLRARASSRQISVKTVTLRYH